MDKLFNFQIYLSLLRKCANPMKRIQREEENNREDPESEFLITKIRKD